MASRIRPEAVRQAQRFLKPVETRVLLAGVEECQLAKFADGPCSGRLVRAHLLDKQVLKRLGLDVWDERSWVWACGGRGYGNEGHHGEFDARKIRVPRCALPAGVEELAREIGAVGRLERRYGALT